MPCPGAALSVTDSFPNMMYHFDIRVGACPDCPTVKAAPLLSYVGAPCAVNSSDAPSWKLTESDLLRAGSAGHPDCDVGLQLEYVCAVVEDVKTRPARRAIRSGDRMASRLCNVNMSVCNLQSR